MDYTHRRAERGKEWERRKKGTVLYLKKDLDTFLVRMNISDPNLRKICDALSTKSGVFATCVIRVKGTEYVDLERLAEIKEQLSAVEAGAVKKLHDSLDRDLTLSGKKSERLEKFKEARAKLVDETRNPIRDYCVKSEDYSSELSEGSHPVESKELLCAFKEVRSCLQNIVQNLFRAAGLKNLMPLVHLTKDRSINAFVLRNDSGVLLKDYLQSGSKEEIELPIFINLGLVNNMDTIDELAGVLAHEFSHLLQPKYFKEDKSPEESQRLEYDADAEGMKIADASGYNPRGLIEAFHHFGKSDGSSLGIIFGSSHPPTASRIVELEKLFNSTDLPLPNAARKMSPFPDKVKEALVTIREKDKKPEARGSEFSDKTVPELLEIMAELNGYQYYLTVEGQRSLESGGSRVLQEEFRVQEFAHGTMGYRKLFLEKLHSFLLALKIAEKQKQAATEKGEELQVGLSYPNLQGEVWSEAEYKMVKQPMGQVSDEELTIEQRVLWANTPDEIKKMEVNSKIILGEKEQRKEMVAKNDLESRELNSEDFEDWLKEDEYTSDFWDLISKRYYQGAPLGRADKLFCLKKIFFEFLHLETRNQYNNNILAVETSKLVKSKIKKKIIKPRAEAAKLAILDSLPLAGRVHKRREEESPLEEVEIEEEISKIVGKTVYATTKYYVNLEFDSWSKKSTDQPPLVREFSKTLEEKTVMSYREFLKHEGLENISDKALRFVLSHLYNNIDEENGRLLIFRQLDKVDIKFLNEVNQILECKNLHKVFSTDGSCIFRNRQNKLHYEILSVIAFGLEAKDDEEYNTQIEYLRRFELDPTAPPGIQLDLGLSEDCDVKLNEKYLYGFQLSGGKTRNQNSACLRVSDTHLAATEERLWLEYGKKIVDKTEQVGSEQAAERVYTSHILETDIASKLAIFFGLQSKDLKRKFKETKLKALAGKVLNFVEQVRGYIEVAYSEGLLTDRTLQNFFKEERNFQTNDYGTTAIHNISHLVDEGAKVMQTGFLEIGKQGEYAGDISKLLWQVLKSSYTLEDVLERIELVRGLDGNSDQDKIYKETENEATCFSDGSVWLHHRPKDSALSYRDKTGQPFTSAENVLKYLEKISRPGVKELKDFFVKKYQGKYSEGDYFFLKIKALCLGNFVSFTQFTDDIHPKNKEKFYSTFIEFWRKLSVVYREDWSQIEGFKKLDEQMSHWEWIQLNPAGLGVDVERIDNRDRKKPKKIIERENFPKHLYEEYAFFLSRIYKRDNIDLQFTGFSWQLFMQDVWNGDATEFIVKNIETLVGSDKPNAEKMGKFRQDLPKFRSELKRVVEDRGNLEEIKKMQPGFFKEFILDKKMQFLGVQTLEEIEEWAKHFTSFAHEGSERNQISSQIENAKQTEKSWKKKKEFFVAALQQEDVEILNPESFAHTMNGKGSLTVVVRLPCEERIEFKVADTDLNAENLQNDGGVLSLSDRGIIIYDVAHLVNVQSGKYTIQERGKFDLRQTEYDVKVNKVRKKKINTTYDKAREFSELQSRLLQRYNLLSTSSEERLGSLTLAKESEVMVFSDQVVENEKSRLEIGPVYRLRWVSQPLMDWHTKALDEAENLADTEKLSVRVLEDLPDRHPLRDVFIKNQLAVEIWQILETTLGADLLEKLGVQLNKTDIDLDEVLEHFPLYKDISFLKKYRIFKVENVVKALEKLPKEQAYLIRHKIEQAMSEKISPDAKPVLRRLLMEVERIALWPELQENIKKDPGTFDEYLHRINSLYEEPTWEKDYVLESIGMDLAQTPDQIRQVWMMRYSEEVKWPKGDESKMVGRQFSSIEKFRFYIAGLNPIERSDYLIWMLGGKQPFAEKFSVEQTGISLEERANVLWEMTPNERRHLLYDLLLGQNGVMEAKGGDTSLADDASDEDVENIYPWKMWERENDLIRHTVDNVFKSIFKEQRIDDSLPEEHETNQRGKELLETIFRELFVQQKEPARRAELMVNIVEAVGATKKEGKEMSAGEIIKLLLEQIGVVGIKAGQVLSEQPGLLPEKIRRELSGLKDKTKPFSKRGLLAYAESAGLVHGDEGMIRQIGEIVGSASIKEVAKGLTEDNQIVAIKGKQPNIDKNFVADMEVLRKIVAVLESKKFNVPSYLLDEIERLVIDELSFVNEAENQRKMGESLKQREATLELSFKSGSTETVFLGVTAPLQINEVSYPGSEEDEDIGLMVEEFVHGLSLKEIQEFQRAVEESDVEKIKEIGKRLAELYGKERLQDIEKRILDLDVGKLQSELGLEFLREVTTGGIFHADLHSGNFYLDVVPLLKPKATFIDLGSVGCSKSESMPNHLKKKYEGEYDGAEDFRDFLTSLFGLQLRPEKCLLKISELVKKYASVSWDEGKIQEIIGSDVSTKDKANKILYALLEESGEKMDSQFRYLLKATVTAADHLDNLSRTVMEEMVTLDENVAKRLLAGEIDDVELKERGLVTLGKINKEKLINLDLLGLKELLG